MRRGFTEREISQKKGGKALRRRCGKAGEERLERTVTNGHPNP